MKDSAPKRRTIDERMADAGLPVLKSTSHECIQLYVMKKVRENYGDLIFSDGEWWQFGPLGAWIPLDRNIVWREIRALDGVETMEGRTDKKSGKAIRVDATMCASILKLAASEYAEEDAFGNPDSTNGVPKVTGFITPAGLWSCNSSDGWSVRKPMPEDRVRLWYGRDPDMRTEPTRWLKFLARVWGHEADFEQRRDFIHEWMVATLMGKATLHQMAPILVGEGKNGKSQMINVIGGMVPPQLRCSVTPDRLENNNFASSALVGKALNMVAEVPGGELLTSNRIKQIIDGSQQDYERKHKDSYQFKPTCGHIFGCNVLPKVNDLSDGFWRRWMPLTFTAPKITVEEQIQGYGQIMLDEEGPAILGYAMNVYANMEANSGKYTIPASREAAIRQWRTDSDTVTAWLEECTRPINQDEDKRPIGTLKSPTSTRELYTNYRGWCREAGHKFPVAINTFGHRLAVLGFEDQRDAEGARRPVWIMPKFKDFTEREEARNRPPRYH